jgi:hypothetical protein
VGSTARSEGCEHHESLDELGLGGGEGGHLLVVHKEEVARARRVDAVALRASCEGWV